MSFDASFSLNQGADFGATGGQIGPAAAGGGINLGGVSAIASLGSSVFGAIGAYRAGKAARKYSKKQAKQAERAGRMNASTIAINRRKLAGQQRAAFAASGVVATSGSPLDLMIDNYILGLIEESRALTDATYRAENIAMQGAVAQRAGVFSATQQLTVGLYTAEQRGLFSIKDNPVVQTGQTLLGALRN